MNKTALLIVAGIMVCLPGASASVWAGFVGTSECNGSTQLCSYSMSGLHGSDLIDVPDVGWGFLFLGGSLLWGSCVFTSLSPCISGTFAETAIGPGQCGMTLVATSESLVLGGSAQAEHQLCNPY
jgi:hypothetical protein